MLQGVYEKRYKVSRAVIMLGGTITDYEFTKKLIADDDFIVCADGGILHLYNMGLSPNVWIGDNDSCVLSDEKFNAITKNSNIILLNPIKDSTDGEECCDYVCEHNFDEAIILGYFGTRLDHVMCNVFLLKKFADKCIKAKAINEHNEVFFADKHNEINENRYKYVSILPLSQELKGVTTNGLYYCLNNGTLSRYSSMGISNEMILEKCVIDIKQGDALIILSKD